MLANSPEIWHVNKRYFSNSIALAVINKFDKGAVVEISTMFGSTYHVACQWVFSSVNFYTFINDVCGVRNLGNTKSIRVIFFVKMFKTYFRFRKCRIKFRKSFCFWYNCISIGIVKFSLLRTGYLPLAANVLTRSPKIWHVTKRDFFQLNCLSSDQ